MAVRAELRQRVDFGVGDMCAGQLARRTGLLVAASAAFGHDDTRAIHHHSSHRGGLPAKSIPGQFQGALPAVIELRAS